VFPCDRLLPDADAAYFRAIDVDASASTTFRWLCQLRVAPYSYDWIDNLGRRSPRELTHGLEELEVGQQVMSIFNLVDFAQDAHLTLLTRPGRGELFGRFACSYTVVTRAVDCSRIVVKLQVVFPRGPHAAVLRRLLPWGDLVMMRKQLRTLKFLAEAQARREARDW